ncbi:proton-coupled folate transporter-like isoform X2 [Homarus americanus]|uniref:proton-coupled folate transporter-like isoform X2 n=1 Tax=Homarus americanus TaxID=6706 RepID=UPI001C457633|nr:proton-coupled folate transporter-like isoform X2 [Homarus americanus]
MHTEKRLKCVGSPRKEGDEGQKACSLAPPALVWAVWLKLRAIFSNVAVEPIMLLDGLAYSIMIVFVEDIQVEKICHVNLNYTSEVCANLSRYSEENIKVHQSVSVFGMYNGIMMSSISVFFILFMGAWSDKYGRKTPLYIATLGHFCWAIGYLLNSWVTEWPVEYLLVAALLDSLGGGNVSFLTAANAYLSDVTSEETRTMRVGLANSIWYLGGPIGTLLGLYIYQYGGYRVLFGTSVLLHCVSLAYLFFLPESHGPFAKNKFSEVNGEPQGEKPSVHLSLKKPSEIADCPDKVSIWKIISDFFHYERIVDSFRCTFKAREGLVRPFILLLILCNLLRRLGRGAYMFLFTRRVLGWKATDYGLWVTYKNLLAAVGSLVAVPLLSKVLGLADNYLAMLGALASVADYTFYGLVSKDWEFLVWIAPVAALLVNSCVIAIRSILSKFVTGDELGKVSAVMGALDGVMPMIIFSLYTAIYHATVHVFPGAQFFFGASANLLMTLIFIFIICCTTSKSYSLDDLHSLEGRNAVEPKSFRFFSERFNRHLQPASSQTEILTNLDTQRTSLVLSEENFHIATPMRKKKNIKMAEVQRHEGGGGCRSVCTVSELGNFDKKVIEDELTFPQRMTSHKIMETKKELEKCGVDNPAFCNTEEEEEGEKGEERDGEGKGGRGEEVVYSDDASKNLVLYRLNSAVVSDETK